MSLNLGPDFERELITLAGWDPTGIDTGSTDIVFLNPSGPTTVRATATTTVDSDTLRTLIAKYATPPSTT